MRAFFPISIAAVLATRINAASLRQRADPRFDIYLHNAEQCRDLGETCWDMPANTCCTYAKTPPALPLFGSTSYAFAGTRQKSSGFEAQLFSARGTGSDPDYNACGLQIAKDDTCADDGGMQASTGAKVNDGSGTLRRRAAGPPKIVYTTHYFYRDGIKQWTLAINSRAGAAYRAVPKGRKEAYLMQHGTLKIYL